MNVKFTESALEELNFFRENEPDIFEKIKILIANIKEMPFKGLGKPEALKHNLQGYWSRRITLEHRFSV
jgi:toxin YoeB